jgi:metal-responsive CopG/Arc/MetJ family transcriptional regulator
MSNTIRTTISLRKSLFEEAEAIAQDMGIARSQVFALAMEEFVQRRKNQRLLEQINAAYEDGLDAEERATLDQMLLLHREAIEDE